MNVIKSILIPFVDTSISANYIMETLYCNDIATVSRVTLIHFTTKSGSYNRAYVDIHEWHETEVAYNLISKMYNTNKEARLVHSVDDDWWAIEINNDPNITHNKQFNYNTTINFLVGNCDEDAALKTNVAGLLILNYLRKQVSREEIDWREIECGLYQMDLWRNLEYELCL